MVYKLHTSKKTQEIFTTLGQSIGLQPFILAKLAISLSINSGGISDDDFPTDNEGLELSRQTIFGEHDLLFKCLIISHENRQIVESEFFPKLVKAHLDRGAILLNNEKKYSRNFFAHLCNLDSTI